MNILLDLYAVMSTRRSLRSVGAALLISLIAAGCTDVPTEPATQTMSDVEQVTHQKINAYRATMGLAPLTFNTAIAAQARAHSRNMANGSVLFSHDGFDSRVETIATSLTISSAAENVAFNVGFDDPAANAVQGWLNSSGHRENIEGDYTMTGIGVEKNDKGEFYFTQIFVK